MSNILNYSLMCVIYNVCNMYTYTIQANVLYIYINCVQAFTKYSLVKQTKENVA